jgi:hypothetical protein
MTQLVVYHSSLGTAIGTDLAVEVLGLERP